MAMLVFPLTNGVVLSTESTELEGEWPCLERTSAHSGDLTKGEEGAGAGRPK